MAVLLTRLRFVIMLVSILISAITTVTGSLIVHWSLIPFECLRRSMTYVLQNRASFLLLTLGIVLVSKWVDVITTVYQVLISLWYSAFSNLACAH